MASWPLPATSPTRVLSLALLPGASDRPRPNSRRARASLLAGAKACTSGRPRRRDRGTAGVLVRVSHPYS